MPNSEPTKVNERQQCGSCEWWFPLATTAGAFGLCNSAKGDKDQTADDDGCEHWSALGAPAGPAFGVIGSRSHARPVGNAGRVLGRDHLDNSADGMRATRDGADDV